MLNLLFLYWLGYILFMFVIIFFMDIVVLMGEIVIVDVFIFFVVFFCNEFLNFVWNLNWIWCEYISVFVYNNVIEKRKKIFFIDIK